MPGSRFNLQQFPVHDRSGKRLQSGVVRQRRVLCLRHHFMGAQLCRAGSLTWTIGTTMERVEGRRLTDGEIGKYTVGNNSIESSACRMRWNTEYSIMGRPALLRERNVCQGPCEAIRQEEGQVWCQLLRRVRCCLGCCCRRAYSSIRFRIVKLASIPCFQSAMRSNSMPL